MSIVFHVKSPLQEMHIFLLVLNIKYCCFKLQHTFISVKKDTEKGNPINLFYIQNIIPRWFILDYSQLCVIRTYILALIFSNTKHSVLVHSSQILCIYCSYENLTEILALLIAFFYKYMKEKFSVKF